MPWNDLPTGSFGAVAHLPGIDANFVWADGSAFVDFRREGWKPPTMVHVIVRMKPGRTVLELRTELKGQGGFVPPAYPDDAQHCTAFFPESYCRAVLAIPPTLGAMIERFDMQMSVIPHRAPPLFFPPLPSPPPMRPTAGVDLIGVIDVGCAFAHEELRLDDALGAGTRVLSIWDQDWFSPLPHATPDFGLGREVYRDSLNATMRRHSINGAIDEEACYRELGMGQLLGAFSHGTAVLGLLAGTRPLGERVSADPELNPSWQRVQDRASQADIVFVQLPRDSNQDSSSAALAGQVLDGLRYILAHATSATQRIVVNISTGASRYTHDGQAIVEAAMEELLHKEKRLHIVFAAANSYADMRHAVVGPLPKGKSETLTLQLPPGNETASYVVVRFDEGSQLKMRLTPPGETPAVGDFVAVGEAKGWPSATAPLAGVVVPAPLPGLAGAALVALAPTHGDRRVASGRWRLELRADADITTPIHLHITRNQVNPGALPRSQQMRFVDVDETHHPRRYLRFEDDDAKSPGSPIKRLGSLNSFATRPEDRRLWVVGSYRLRDGVPSAYSSAGPAAGVLTKRRKGPDVSAAADEGAALPGIRAAGPRSGMTVRVSGTSFAAPQVARELLNTGTLSGLQGPKVPHRNGKGNLPP
jgi:hypothetical protein